MKLTKLQVSLVCKKLREDLISFKLLGRGSHNENYLIKTKKDNFVLRIECNHQFKNLRREYKFLKKTKGKLGPKVFLFDNSKKIILNDYLVEEFFEGTHPKKRDSKFVKSMALWYKELHKNKIKKSPHSLLKADWIKIYKKYIALVDEKLKKELNELFNETIEIIKKNEKLFSKDKYAHLVHGDPYRKNIFYDNGKLKLIDWEFVGYNRPEVDLVFFVWSHKLNKKQGNLFLSTYGYSKSEKRFNIFLLTHLLAMISWRLERLDLFKKKKIKRDQYPKSRKEIYEDIGEDVENLRKVFGKR